MLEVHDSKVRGADVMFPPNVVEHFDVSRDLHPSSTNEFMRKGFRTVFEPRSNRVRTAFEPPGNAIPIKLVGFRTGVDETGGWDF